MPELLQQPPNWFPASFPIVLQSSLHLKHKAHYVRHLPKAFQWLDVSLRVKVNILTEVYRFWHHTTSRTLYPTLSPTLTLLQIHWPHFCSWSCHQVPTWGALHELFLSFVGCSLMYSHKLTLLLPSGLCSNVSLQKETSLITDLHSNTVQIPLIPSLSILLHCFALFSAALNATRQICILYFLH